MSLYKKKMQSIQFQNKKSVHHEVITEGFVPSISIKKENVKVWESAMNKSVSTFLKPLQNQNA